MRLFYKKTSLWLILCGSVLALGCRGSMPFGRTVQITKSSDAAEIEIDTPEQRLATGKPDSDDDAPLQDVESEPTVSVAAVADESDLALASSESNDNPTEDNAVVAVTGEAVDEALNTEESIATGSFGESSENGSEESIADARQVSGSLTAAEGNPASADQIAVDLDGDMSPNELLEALNQYPPSVREKAVAQFVQMVANQANLSEQPNAVEEQIARSLESAFEMPSVEVESGSERPSRIGAEGEQMPLVQDLDESVAFAISDDAVISKVNAELPSSDIPVSADQAAGETAKSKTSISESENSQPSTSESEITVADSGETISLSEDLAETELPRSVEVASAEDASLVEEITQVSLEEAIEPSESAEVETTAVTTEGLSQKQLLAALILSLQKPEADETDSDRQERLVKLSHLMVLSGDPESALRSMSEMGAGDQLFLHHQLKGLWHLIDPEGHPSPSHRLTSVASEFREAAKHAGAATDALEVRRLTFCKEIEAYGQVKPFDLNHFQSGQQIILYCEVENFRASQSEIGYELHLQGSYEIFDSEDQRIFSQVLPADKQVSSNYLRDYFVAYQMFLPAELATGHYRLQLTMEDVVGKKYGQAKINFEIKP